MEYKAGMYFYAFAILLGTVFVQQLAVLPDFSCLLFCLLATMVVYLLHRHLPVATYPFSLKKYLTLSLSFILLFFISIIYSSYYSANHLEHRFNSSFVGEDILLTGRVASIPIKSSKVQRFEFDVYSAKLSTRDGNTRVLLNEKFPKKVRLSWYYGKRINADEQWQIVVRLKPPHGFMNPGGFDYEGWLFQQGIDATGYIRQSTDNRLLAAASAYSVNHIRQMLSNSIDEIQKSRDEAGTNANQSSLALVKALSIGDKSLISVAQWEVLKNTGTSHLMAISGLHIGLAAFFAYVVVRRLSPVYIMKRVPAQHVAIVMGMVVALLYALIAGFSIPTQRAIIMLFVLSSMLLIRRNHRPIDALGLAAIVVLLIDPLAVLSAGFWFSFSAVAVIFISVSNMMAATDMDYSAWGKAFIVIKQWLRLQLLISLFLFPLSLYMFQQASIVSPVANLLLIPYVSFLVVPVVLVAIASSFISPVFSEMLFSFAASLLDFIWPLLTYLSKLPFAYWVKGDVTVSALLIVTLSLLVIYYSKHVQVKSVRWSLRIVSLLSFVLLFMPDDSDINTAEYHLTVLDVGQGSAAVIRTQNHLLVFDTGARFSDKMNAGASAVVPYLRSLGEDELSKLIISHGDNDHIGGAQAVINAYPGAELIGQDIESLVSDNKLACHNQMRWQWDDVDFEFLSPAFEGAVTLQSKKSNNRSCVLKVSSIYGSVLLTGDIEKRIETALVENYAEKLNADILLVPHHGSNTSSSRDFLQRVNPEYSIISVGYKNRYKLPSSKVIARYAALDLALLRTDKSGAITVKISDSEGISVTKYRNEFKRYWHHIWN